MFDLSRFQTSKADQEGQAALQGVTDPGQIDEALGRNPSNGFLQTMSLATRLAREADLAVEKLTDQLEPPALSNRIDLGTASRTELEALRRDLKTAEANATTSMPRQIALMKTERDKVAQFAFSRIDTDAANRLLEGIDRRHAESAEFISRMLSAHADFYRAYEKYVAVLAGEFGSYKVANGEFIFPLQRTVDRYNVAAKAMSAAAKRVAELEDERKRLAQSQMQAWLRFVNGK
jgi:methyl-accepting chemotaxis protein